ncbi:MAG: hypothetical protein H6654_14215 [Ardenticatenaceae bacterium]|nr:hypothetical protein [Anaerolineales bacterium]MCB8938956.1 hypothetical protein [Ardenticatenaceae bacterium]MCB8974712.1 hypothetical protein [Ardenticatenaceae bacterium]
MENKPLPIKKRTEATAKLSWKEWLAANNLLAEEILTERDGRRIDIDRVWKAFLEDREKRIDQILDSSKE